MANNRIYYAIQQVAFNTGVVGSGKVAVHGLQSVGLTTNFNLEQVFELGQLSLYQNVETIPEIEVTLNKVLDGYPLIYVMATENGSQVTGGSQASGPDLTGRQNGRVDMTMTIYNDTESSVATKTAMTEIQCSGMYVSSVSYTFPVDGNFTEDVTLVGNDKVFATASFDTGDATLDGDDSPIADEGVNRRQHLQMSSCRFPTQIPGIDASGINQSIGNGSGFGAHFTNVTVSCDLGRESIFELGSLTPYHRYVSFPVEVTCEFEVTATSGDGINAAESGYYTGSPLYAGTASVATTGTAFCAARFNLLDQRIFLETCEGTRIQLGSKNKLTSVNYTGGDTGGGNATITYSYSNFNDFIVAHSGGTRGGSPAAGGKTGANNFWAGVAASGYTAV